MLTYLSLFWLFRGIQLPSLQLAAASIASSPFAKQKMGTQFFDRPILNSPYAYPGRHWELDADGQPTGHIIETRRDARFITPIPRPKKHKRAKGQERLVFDEGAGVSTAKQQYDPTPILNELRRRR